MKWSNLARRAVLSALAGAVVLTGASCGQQSVVLPSRDFDRPTDMTFACLGLATGDDGKVRVFGQPMGQCHPAQVADQGNFATDMDGARRYRTYAFVPNAERGDLTMLDFSYCRGATSCWPSGAGLVDLDPLAVGWGAAPLGELPEVVAASQDGCRVVSANRGSCDLTLVDPAALLAGHGLPASQRPSKARPYARTIVPRTSSGRLAVAPGEVAFLPQQTMKSGGNEGLCDPDGVEGTMAPPVGMPAGASASPWRAVVTFPSCDLIALLDLPSGDILDSFQVTLSARTENGVTVPEYTYNHTGRNPVCPVSDCGATPGGAGGSGGNPPNGNGGAGGVGGEGGGAGGAAGSAGGSAGGAAAGGAGGTAAATQNLTAAAPGPLPAPLRLGAMAIHPEGKRVYFGTANAPVIGALDIGGTADALAIPAEGASTELHDGARGVVRLRLSVDPYDYSKGSDAKDPTRAEYGRFVASRHDEQPADPFEFLYAIAKDGTVRVVHVGRPVPTECDLGIDPRSSKAGALGTVDRAMVYPQAACFPYGAADGPRRLLFAGGPGLRLPSTPQDIAFANYRSPDRGTEPAQETLDEQTLNGAFAFILTTGAQIYIVNIDPELRTPLQRYRDASGNLQWGRQLTEEPRPLTHSLRDANVITYSTSLGNGAGPPRLDADPSVPVDGPRLMSFPTVETRLDARNIGDLNNVQPRNTYVYFPNRATVNAQAWGISWEADLTATRNTGDIVTPQAADQPPPFMTTITDNGAGFCGAGVDGDVMTLVGCTRDTDCYAGHVCVHSTRVPPSVDGRVIPGMCLRKDRVTELRERCQPMMETFRRYEIVRNTAQAATVVPRRAEVPRPVYTNALGERAACELASNSQLHQPYGCQPTMSTIHDKFRCMRLTARPDGTPLVAPNPTASPPVLGDVAYRCFQGCSGDGDCQQGRVCLAYPGLEQKVCAEAPPIDKECGLDQLIPYRVGAGGAFVVAGTATGRTERVRTQTGPNGPECVPDFTSSPTLVARMPMNLPVCDAASLPSADPQSSNKLIWDAAFFGRDPAPSPNPCLVFQSALTGALSTPAQCAGERLECKVSVLFQNNELRFVLTDLQTAFTDATQIRFDVHGGTAPQLVSPAIDAGAGLPARLVLGPIPQPEQTEEGLSGTCLRADMPDICKPGRKSDLPYMYIVDQRQLVNGAVGVRGQILRVTPRIADGTAPVPGVESFTAGGRYFPIQ